MSVDPDPQDLGETDPESGAPSRPPRALHLRASSMALVFAGGAVGTTARHLLTLAIPALAGMPMALLACNLLGALLLGALLESLARRGPDEGLRRSLRLLLGTGLMGGFTSYSSLALATEQLLRAPHGAGLALAYGLGSILLGVIAAGIGIALAAARHPRQEARA